MSAAVVVSSDRLTFTLFLALLLHAMVVFGVSFLMLGLSFAAQKKEEEVE